MLNPYRNAGYNTVQIDIANGDDVRLLEYPGNVHGIIAQPPCTHLAGSGARWWKEKGESALLDALAIVDACLRFIAVCNPQWWVLENPVGRLSRYLGKPKYTFNPCDFALLADDKDAEQYTKKTCLWGEFVAPHPIALGVNTYAPPIHGSKMHKLPPGENRAALRSVAPSGFAKAFFMCNP